MTAVTPTTFTARFVQAHPLPAGGTLTITGRGNPGPWPGYDPRHDAEVVPFFSVIE